MAMARPRGGGYSREEESEESHGRHGPDAHALKALAGRCGTGGVADEIVGNAGPARRIGDSNRENIDPDAYGERIAARRGVGTGGMITNEEAGPRHHATPPPPAEHEDESSHEVAGDDRAAKEAPGDGRSYKAASQPVR